MRSEDAGLIGATSPPMDLTTIYAPIQDELSRLHRLLEQELAADDPFVSELVRHVLSTQGKMIRPALVCLSPQAGGGAGEAGPGPWWRATPPPPSASGLSACSGAWRFRSPTTPWI